MCRQCDELGSCNFFIYFISQEIHALCRTPVATGEIGGAGLLYLQIKIFLALVLHGNTCLITTIQSMSFDKL